MGCRTITKLLFVTVVAALLPIQPSYAVTMQIDTAQSVVHTTSDWMNWDWSWGAPSDGIDIGIPGTFDLAVEPGVINAFTNAQSPTRILFANINVPTSGSNGRTWQFPSFEGFFSEYSPSSFNGSEDGCFSFPYYLGGSCWSAGNFGSYSGTWDGSTLILSGSKSPDFYTGNNGFSYTIVATAVPEPVTYVMLLVGLGLVGFTAGRRKGLAA